MNRLLKKSFGSLPLETYIYDPAGQLTNRADTSGTYTWVFDNRGRVKTNSTPVGTLYYQYDNNGNQTSLASATPGGVNLTYQYDVFNRLTHVLDVNLGLSATNTGYAYDGVGNLQHIFYPNGVTNVYGYDTLNRLTTLTWGTNGGAQANFTYQLGPSGNRTNLSETIGSTSRNFAWGYDNVYRLTSEIATASGSSNILNYGYDNVGNRLTRANGGFSLTNQSFSFNSNDWLNGDSYDNNGNTTGSSGVTYQYDYANRLTNFNNGSTLNIVYDADGNRISKMVGSTTTLYLVSAVNPTGYPQVVEEFTVSGTSTTLSKVYTYGLSLISQRQGSTDYFFGTDGHGSTRFLTDGSGSIQNVFAYDAYGNLIASNSAPQTAYLYSGEQWDANLGMSYNLARYLNPNTGRFLTMDTDEGDQEEPLSLHKYLYASCSPVDRIDPSGNDDGDVGSLQASTGLAAGLAAFSVAAIAVANNHALSDLAVATWDEAISTEASKTAAAGAALAVFQTSAAKLIKQAKNILSKTGQLVRNLKIVPMPKSIIPAVANHVAMAQAGGYPALLTRVTPLIARANRRAALAGRGSAGFGQSWDEYPFASGRPPVFIPSVVPVPLVQNRIQGWIISACYRLQKITPGTPYIVVVTP